MEFVPPRKVFQVPPGSPQQALAEAGYEIPDFTHAGLSSSGGMLSYFKGHPLPRKGFTYSEVIPPLNKVKRITMCLFQPLADIRKGLRAFAESYLQNYNRLVDSMFVDCERIPYLKYSYYCEFSKASWDFTYDFLRYLGISFNTAYRTGLQVATIFEFDDAYRCPLEDIFSETTKERLLENPRKELLRLLDIYKQRSVTFSEDGMGAGNRIEKMAKFVVFLLRIPAFKNAFTFALRNSKFEYFQYDEYDRYWALNRIDYMSFGEPFERRKESQINQMIEYANQMNPGKEVVRVEDEKGIKINVIENGT